MALDETHAGEAKLGQREKWIGVYIGTLAVILAICSLGGGNAAKDATLKNIEAANTWAFFQAKNARRQALYLQIDDFELLRDATPEMTPAARDQIAKKLDAYRTKAAQLTSDPERKEGLDELFTRGKALEAERDEALRRDPYFDYGEALLQIAIVMASVAIISGGSLVLGISAVLGILGTVATIGGFTLAFPLPFG